MKEIIIQIIPILMELLATIAVLAITKSAIPWFKAKVTATEDKRLYDTICRMVQAAEKLAEAGSITKDLKKKFVIQHLVESGIEYNEYTDALIEAAVKELDWMGGEIMNSMTDNFGEQDDEA